MSGERDGERDCRENNRERGNGAIPRLMDALWIAPTLAALRTGAGRGPGSPFGPVPSRRRRARITVVYWVPGPLLGSNPPPGWSAPPRRTAGPAPGCTDGVTSVTGAGTGEVERRPTGQSRAGLGSKLPTPAQMSTVSLTAETSSFRSWDMIDESRQWSHVIRCRSSRASASGSDPPWTTPRRWVARVSAT